MIDVSYDSDAGVYRAKYDLTDDLSYAIACTVGEATDKDPIAVEPLYDVIDPDALESLVRSLRKRDNEKYGTVEFTLSGYLVRVRTDGVLEIVPQ